jgi:hypothetical protein
VAVDSRAKRSSILGLKLPFGRVFPHPDGSLDAADRAQTVFEYAGNWISVAVVRAARRHRMSGLIHRRRKRRC